jgi:hypothetical protein
MTQGRGSMMTLASFAISMIIRSFSAPAGAVTESVEVASGRLAEALWRCEKDQEKPESLT